MCSGCDTFVERGENAFPTNLVLCREQEVMVIQAAEAGPPPGS